MKIVYLSDDFPPISFGGAGISTFELAKAISKLGNDVSVITTCRKESDAGTFFYEGIKVFRIATNYNGKWRAYISLHNPSVVGRVEEILRDVRPDVVHANNIHAYLSYYCLVVAKKYARRVVFTARDTMSFTYGKLVTKNYLSERKTTVGWLDNVHQAKFRWNPFRNFIIKRRLSGINKRFAVSDSLREALEKNGILNVETIHTGIDTRDWDTGDSEVALFKSRHNLTGKRVILFGGRLSEAKGGASVLKALARIAPLFPETVLLVAGDSDSYGEAMKEEAVRIGIGKNIIFTGWIPRENMKIVYRAADVVVVPSLYLDPFPRIVLEAMASSRPVIGSCYGGSPEAIVDGITGYIINPNDTDSFAEKLKMILGDQKLATRLGQSARAHIEESFTLDTVARKYIMKYE